MRIGRLVAILALALSLCGLPLYANPATGTLARTLEVLPAGNEAVTRMGTWRGTDMAREATGIAVASGAVVEARVANNVSGVRLDLVTDTSQLDTSTDVPASGAWVGLTAKADAGVFFRLRDASVWPTAPRVEFRVLSGTHFTMPEFRRGSTHTSFVAEWEDSGSPFAVIVDTSVSILVPKIDREAIRTMQGARFTSLNEVIDFYRDLVATYDDWLGLSSDDPVAHHRSLAHRYFVRPDRTGAGAAYYAGRNYLGLNGPTALPYILGNDQWLILHEVGHGYDGFMTGAVGIDDLELGEVWNNIYAHSYETRVMGLNSGWLYQPDRAAGQAALDQQRRQAGGVREFNRIDHRARLDVLARIADLTGMEGFRDFNRTLRDLNAQERRPQDIRRTDLIAERWGAPSGVNLIPWLESFSARLSPDAQARLLDLTPATMAMPLRDLMPEAEAVAAAASLSAVSPGDLTTTADIRLLGISTTATVALQGDAAAVEGRHVTLWDATTKVATAPFVDGTATFTGLPVGTYTVHYPQARTTGFVPASDWLLAATPAPAGANVTVSYPQESGFSPVGDTEVRLHGLGDALFAQLSYDRDTGQLTVNDKMARSPHPYFPQDRFPEGYASITVTAPSGVASLRRTFLGDGTSPGPAETVVSAPIGTRATLMHAEAPTRLRPVATTTGTARNDLAPTGTSTSYVVTEFGLAKEGSPDTALEAFVDELSTALQALEVNRDTYPEAWLAPQASSLTSAVGLLPQDRRQPVLSRYGSLLDAALLPATEPRPTAQPTPTSTPTPAPTTSSPSPEQSPSVPTAGVHRFVPTAPYTKAGLHEVNGRAWHTECEPYSRTVRCRTDIWATVVQVKDGKFERREGWAFNNLTYLPYMAEASWQGNPLASHDMAGFTSGGRQWRTECHTPQTGRGACRSYTLTTVYTATAKLAGGYAFTQSNQWVFNNIVLFGGPALR